MYRICLSKKSLMGQHLQFKISIVISNKPAYILQLFLFHNLWKLSFFLLFSIKNVLVQRLTTFYESTMPAGHRKKNCPFYILNRK